MPTVMLSTTLPYSNGIQEVSSRAMLTAKDISKTLNGKQVLRDVSVNMRPGEITALIGPNGCGKSTLLRALALLDPPDVGQVAIDGRSYTFPMPTDQVITPPWPDVTIVFQQLFLWPHLTLRQNIALPLRKRNGRAYKQKVEEVIALLGMEDYIDRYPNQVSLGQRQRAAIGRALAVEPKYLLLDEITSALDVEQVSLILEQIKLLRERGTSIMLVTHLIGFARRAASQVLFMWEGQILEAGGTELLSAPESPEMARFLSLLE